MNQLHQNFLMIWYTDRRRYCKLGHQKDTLLENEELKKRIFNLKII